MKEEKPKSVNKPFETIRDLIEQTKLSAYDTIHLISILSDEFVLRKMKEENAKYRKKHGIKKIPNSYVEREYDAKKE